MMGYRFINALFLLLTLGTGGAMGKESLRSRSNAVESRDLQTFSGLVSALELFNAKTDTKLLDLANNTIVVLSSIPGMTTPAFNIRAATTGSDIAYVIFGYNTTNSYRRENVAPYAFCGNDRTNYFICDKLGIGTHIVTATPYSRSNVAGKSFSLQFQIVATSPPGPPVASPPVAPPVASPPTPPVSSTVGAFTGLTLIRADTDTVVTTLTNGTIVYVKALVPPMSSPTFNTNASFIGNVRSAVYSYNGSKYRTEEVVSYTFCGNNRADFFSCSKLGCGNHTVSIVPYSLGGAGGTAGSSFSVSFSIDCVNGGTPSGNITGLILVNADKDTKVVDPLTNGTVVNIKDQNMTTPSFNINATYNGNVKSVAYLYNGTRYIVEDTSPFAFCENNLTDFFKCDKLGCGTHTVTAVPYPELNAGGIPGTSVTVTFTINCTNTTVPPPPPPPPNTTVGTILALELYNADKDTKITDLTNGTVVSLKALNLTSPSFNINAAYNGTVESVVFFYNGTKGITEDTKPYAFCGNNDGDFFKCRELGCGTHVVTAVPYSGSGATGTAGTARTAWFYVNCTNVTVGTRRL